MILRLLVLSLVTSLAVFFFHTTALSNYLYWYYWWYDLLVHFLTGLSLTFFVLALFLKFSKEDKVSFLRLIVVSFVSVLVASIAWEIFEYTHHITAAAGKYSLDTFSDILLALIGSLVAVTYVRFKENKV